MLLTCVGIYIAMRRLIRWCIISHVEGMACLIISLVWFALANKRFLNIFVSCFKGLLFFGITFPMIFWCTALLFNWICSVFDACFDFLGVMFRSVVYSWWIFVVVSDVSFSVKYLCAILYFASFLCQFSLFLSQMLITVFSFCPFSMALVAN